MGQVEGKDNIVTRFRLLVAVTILAMLVGCGGPAPTATVDISRLTTTRVIEGLQRSGTVRVPDSGAKTTTNAQDVEETVLLLYVGQAIATAFLAVAPPGADMASLREREQAGLIEAIYAGNSGRTPDFRVAQDRNVLLFLSFLTSPDREADRATVEAALKAIR